MKMQLSQYQQQSTPVPSTCDVYPALWRRNITPFGRRHERTGAVYMRCDRLLDYAGGPVYSAEVLQKSDMSTIGDILYHRRLYLFGPWCTPGPWSRRT